MNSTSQKTRNWICPLVPTEKPMILQRDEFLTQILSLAHEYDNEIEVNYKDLTVKFNVSGAEYRLTPDGIVDMTTAVAELKPALQSSSQQKLSL